MSQIVADADKAAFLDWTNELYARIKKGTLPMSAVLAGLQKLVEGDFGSKVIDLDARPFIPEGWSILPEDQIKSVPQGQIDAAKIVSYLSEQQKGYKGIVGDKLREELEGQPVVNANGLDFFLKKENQHLIPPEWKGKAVFFWGTIYRDPHNNLCVRCLCHDVCHDGRWYWHYSSLKCHLFSSFLAVVSAS